MTFIAALIMKEELMSTQWPVVSAFQIFSLGMCSKITTNLSALWDIMLNEIKTWTMRCSLPIWVGTKMRRYCSKIESFINTISGQ